MRCTNDEYPVPKSSTTVAEGVESEAQLRELVKLGCDLGQGHYFARALDAESCLA